jgi:hypothetical protein
MKNLSHLIRVHEGKWINPVHITRIQTVESSELQLFIHLIGGDSIPLRGEDAQKILALLQRAE